jgi:hypothetical protein
MKEHGMLSKPRNQNGGVIVLVAVSMFVLLGFAALAVDVSHLAVARNELQNAADAGALAGAAVLYNDNGTVINTVANQVAYDAATANKSDKVAVDVNWDEVQRGHWSFGLPGSLSDRGFYPHASTTVISLPGLSDADLDGYDGQEGRPVFINAVKVVARRQASGTPILSFFARILGYENFELSADSVAYRGFSGTLLPGDIDLPIAICEESVPNNADCNIGRMINSAEKLPTGETAGWTDTAQEQATGDDPCLGGTNSRDVKNLVSCDGGVNPSIMYGNEPMATNGGEIQAAFNLLINTWRTCATNPVFDASGNEIERISLDTRGQIDGDPPDGIPDLSWQVTLPRIKCQTSNVGPCDVLTGAVHVQIVWILGNAGGYVDQEDGMPVSDAPPEIVPTHMDGWTNMDPDAKVRWADFVDEFDLINVDGSDAPFHQKSIYFKPSCEQADLAGVSGGQNYGVLARIPILVE